MSALLSPKMTIQGFDILARVLGENAESMTPTTAKAFAKIDFSADDKKRMSDLAKRNGRGELEEAEIHELHGFAQVDCLLAILRSRARKALKKAASAKLTR